MKLYAEISKVEDQDDGTIKVWGYASSGSVDSDGETITADAMKAALPDYMKWGAVREMHQAKAAGTAIEATIQDDGRTYFGAHIVDSEAVKKVKANVYKGFSIGGKVTERDDLNKTIIKGLRLVEVSLVDRPANPEAIFTMYKAEGLVKEEAVGALADMLNKGEITPERLVELAKSEVCTKSQTDPATAATDTVTDVVDKTATADDLKKGMYDVSRFAELLTSLCSIACNSEYEAQYEADGSPVPKALRDWMATGIGIFKTMADEESAEMISQMQAMLPAAQTVDVIAAAAKTDDIAKAGAKFSADAKDKLGKAHAAVKAASDHLDSLGYAGDKDPEDDAGKAATGDDLAKVAGELDLAKAEVTKLSGECETLQKRVKQLEAMPAPGKALLKAIGKGDDVGGDHATDIKPVLKSDGSVDETATAFRKVYQSGGQRLSIR